MQENSSEFKNDPTENAEACDRTLASSDAQLRKIQLGEVGPYQRLEFIGMGGSGMVYRAKDAGGSELALKIMTVTPFISGTEIRRFLSEAETSKKLRKHPNIITVYDTGQDGNSYYIAMELVKGGRTFRDLSAGYMSIEETLDLLIPVASALEYAHKEGILHRDVKPANILINEFNQPLLADFGLAKTETAERMTMTGSIMGTPRYMSPEQCGFGDAHPTKQSDIYSFGLLSYELLCGHFPYQISNEMPLPEIFRVICSENAKPLRHHRKDASRNLEAVLARMLEKEKSLRYKDISNVRSDLEACRQGRPVSVRRLSPAEKWERMLRRNAAVSITVAILMTIALFAYFIAFRPKIFEKIYFKHVSDVEAVAAKRKTISLEKELKNIKEGGGKSSADSLDLLLASARNELASANLNDAKKSFTELESLSSAQSELGVRIEALSSLARIEMTLASYDQATKLFEEAEKLSAKDSFSGKIIAFEIAAALHLSGRKDEAKRKWRSLARNDFNYSQGLETKAFEDYIELFSSAMLYSEARRVLADGAVRVSAPFKGLGYWTLAESAGEGPERAEMLKKASESHGAFIWLKKSSSNEKGKQK